MPNKEFYFELIAQDENARLGKIYTPRGIINTPAFMPVGTLGTLKGIFTDDLIKTGTEIILGNTYHLLLRPGTDVLDRFDGLHRYMNWKHFMVMILCIICLNTLATCRNNYKNLKIFSL